MNNQNTILALLLTTAVVLGALVYVAYSPSQALASGTSMEKGDYIMACGQISSSRDLLYLINTASRRMNVYGIDDTTNSVAILPRASVDMTKAFKP